MNLELMPRTRTRDVSGFDVFSHGMSSAMGCSAPGSMATTEAEATGRTSNGTWRYSKSQWGRGRRR